MQKPGNSLIILCVIAIVIGPLCVYCVSPSSQARWVLAQAANEYQNGDPLGAKQSLERAISISPDISADRQYWKLRFQLTLDKSDAKPSDAQALLNESLESIPKLEENRLMATLAVGELFGDYDRVDLAIQLMDHSFPDIKKRPAILNNTLAYFRSLEKTQLDVALQEINIAIQQTVADRDLRLYQLFDTKAWVLHGLGQNQLAYKFADQSVKAAYDSLDNWRMLLEADPLPANRTFKMAAKQANSIQLPNQPTTRVPSESDPFVNNSSSDSPLEIPEQTITAPSDAGLSDAGPKTGGGSTSAPEVNFGRSLLKAVANVKQQRETDPIQEAKKKLRASDHYAFDQAARILAVIRFHRACILEDLGRMEEAEIDYAWLDRFGFTNTQNLR